MTAQSARVLPYGVGRAQAVLMLVIGARRLHVADQCRPEAREAGPNRLQGDRRRAARPARAAGSAGRTPRSAPRLRPSPTRPSPRSRVRRPGSARRRRPSRTTCSMLRSWSSSQVASVGAFAIVGVTEQSMRSMMRASSSRRNKSSSDVAAAAARMMPAAIPRNTAGSGWTTSRLSIQGSRGLTQQIASGSTPRPSSQTQASVAVLPEPTITYWLGSLVENSEVVDRDHMYTVVDPERRRRVRWDVRGEVARVDDPAALRHLEPLAGDARDDLPIGQRTRSSRTAATLPDSISRSRRTRS